MSDDKEREREEDFYLTDEEAEQLEYERQEIVSKIMNDDLGDFSFGMRGNHSDNVPKLKLKPKLKSKRYRLKSKSKLRRLRPQIHYHRARVGVKQRPIVRGFRH